MTQKNVLVAQSGGPTVAINASLAGVIAATCESNNYNLCYGALNGVTGILDSRYLNLTELIGNDSANIEKLKTTPAMYLGSCRHKLPKYEDDSEVYEKIFDQFDKLDIGAFFYIGGNDSMDTVLKLSDYAKKINSNIKIIGVPKTIDNDLCVTDHTPGFGSAAKYIAASILEISHDTYIYKVKSVTIVEIMGRDAGWLTASSALARNEYSEAPHLIYLPEVAFDTEQFIEDVREKLKTTDNVIVAVSEGIRDKDGEYISAGESATDKFGHKQLSGAGKALEFLVKEKINVKVRSVEVNVLQRCASHLASKTDLDESFEQGKKAVSFAEEGVTASMVILKRISNKPYTVDYDYAVIKNIANEAKSIPREWINSKGNDIKQELYDYLFPLIQGEVNVAYSNGLPTYMNVSHLHKRSEN
ncbi:6-phosphofructokinase 1 [Lachnospiraceae bacterium C7]|nr:6-phosphofructokinase 1 [Lachnospiraceae bacterium C7]